MIVEKYIKDVLMDQGRKLMMSQKMIATTSYKKRSGQLLSSLSGSPVLSGLKLGIRYPFYIRFLDLKKKNNKTKTVHEPIYNKYVYGYLYEGVYNRLLFGLSGHIRRRIGEIFEE